MTGYVCLKQVTSDQYTTEKKKSKEVANFATCNFLKNHWSFDMLIKSIPYTRV